jgi:hypothetical protein
MPVLFHKDVLMLFIYLIFLFVLQTFLIPGIPGNRGKLVYPISANKYSPRGLRAFLLNRRS